MKNSDQAKYTINVYVIKAFMSDNPLFGEAVIDTVFAKIGGLTGLEKYLNENSLNQGLIKVKLIDSKNSKQLKIELSSNTFNLANKGFNTMTAKDDPDYAALKGIITNSSSTKFEVDSGKSVNLFNKQSYKLYGLDREKCILLYLCPLNTQDAGGSSYTIPLDNKHCIIFGTNLDDPQSYAHEIAHTLGLEHTFLSKDSSCNLISLTTEKSNADYDIASFRRKINAAKTDVDNHWSTYRNARDNKAYFDSIDIDNLRKDNALYIKYKKSYDDTKTEYDKQLRDYIKEKNDEKGLIDKNNIRFIRSTTENIMDYSREEDCAVPTPNILYRNTNKLISFYKNQWKIIQEEAKTYYH